MRIVYDDAQQANMIKIVKQFMTELNVQAVTGYEYGRVRIKRTILRNKLDERFRKANLTIGESRSLAYGIGDDRSAPVYYQPPGSEEVQHCGNIIINDGLYGECFVSCEDYNGKLVGPLYKISPSNGVTFAGLKKDGATAPHT